MDITAPILRVLQGRSLNGYEIVRFLRETAPELLARGEGLIYPALHMLERRELVCAEWRLSAKGRKRRWYFLTAKGRKRIAGGVPAN